MSEKKQSTLSAALKWCMQNPHFTIACVIIGATALGWRFTVQQMRWAMHKEPVPWTASVEVDHEDFRNISFPVRLGPFRRAKDGELSKETDGKPDGEIIIDEEVMGPLKIGTRLDEQRVSERRSNWYMTRIYVDSRTGEDANPFKYWRLNIFYYTGGLDKVPHVGEICLAAGGATILDSSEKPFEIEGASGAWSNAVDFRQTVYQNLARPGQTARKYVQYYVFDLNGKPENDRLAVRRKLTYPWVKHCYFAKVELAPLSPMTDLDTAKKAAQEFIDYAMPEVLDALPDVQAIQELDAQNE